MDISDKGIVSAIPMSLGYVPQQVDRQPKSHWLMMVYKMMSKKINLMRKVTATL